MYWSIAKIIYLEKPECPSLLTICIQIRDLKPNLPDEGCSAKREKIKFGCGELHKCFSNKKANFAGGHHRNV